MHMLPTPLAARAGAPAPFFPPFFFPLALFAPLFALFFPLLFDLPPLLLPLFLDFPLFLDLAPFLPFLPLDLVSKSNPAKVDAFKWVVLGSSTQPDRCSCSKRDAANFLMRQTAPNSYGALRSKLRARRGLHRRGMMRVDVLITTTYSSGKYVV